MKEPKWKYKRETQYQAERKAKERNDREMNKAVTTQRWAPGLKLPVIFGGKP